MSDPEDAGLLSYGGFGITASQARDDFQNTDINEAESDGSASFIYTVFYAISFTDWELTSSLLTSNYYLIKKVSCFLTVDRIM
jgi:hypothetical protein